MFVNKENWDDVRKYFDKTYVKFPDLTGDQVWKVSAVDPTYIYVQDSKGEEALIQLDKGYNLDYVIPKKTVFQHGERATMLSRIPARMWKKGMSKDNTKFEVLTADGGWKIRDFDISIVEGFINKPSYYSVEDALNDFKKSEHLESAAITSRIALHRKGGVYVDQVLVGRWSMSKKLLQVKKIFTPEISKCFAPMNLEVKMV